MAGKAFMLDLYRPDPASAPTPLVVWIHGINGAHASKATTPAAALATPGYAVASIDYRSAAGTPIAEQVAMPKPPSAGCAPTRPVQYRRVEGWRVRT